MFNDSNFLFYFMVQPQISIVVLKVHMHSEPCSQEMKKRVERIKCIYLWPFFSLSLFFYCSYWIFNPSGTICYINLFPFHLPISCFM